MHLQYLITGFEYIAHLGIPYAKFERHWEKAVYPYPPWTGVRVATEPGQHCWNHGDPPEGQDRKQDDHCLTINVYTPRFSR